MAGDPSVLLFKLSQSRWVDNENPHLLYLRLWAKCELSLQKNTKKNWNGFDLVCDSDVHPGTVERNLTMELQRPLPFQVVEP